MIVQAEDYKLASLLLAGNARRLEGKALDPRGKEVCFKYWEHDPPFEFRID